MSEKAAALFGALAYIDDDIIESALSATPESVVTARVTPFTKRPWMKWAIAAVAIVVFAAGTPIALNMMGAFRNDNIVAPNSDSGVGSEDDDPGFTTPIESSDPESSSEPASAAASGSSEGEKPEHSYSSEYSSEPPTQSYSSENSGKSENQSGSGQGPASSSLETQDEPVTGGEPDSEDPQTGEFIKDNMPPITYRIAGESKTFSYTVSEWVTTHWQSVDARYSIDRYVGNDGSSVLINSETGKLIQYERTVLHGDSPLSVASEVEVIETAKRAVLNTDIAVSGIENAEVSVQESAKGYYVTLAVPEGKVYVSMDIYGSLLGIYAGKSGS